LPTIRSTPDAHSGTDGNDIRGLFFKAKDLNTFGVPLSSTEVKIGDKVVSYGAGITDNEEGLLLRQGEGVVVALYQNSFVVDWGRQKQAVKSPLHGKQDRMARKSEKRLMKQTGKATAGSQASQRGLVLARRKSLDSALTALREGSSGGGLFKEVAGVEERNLLGLNMSGHPEGAEIRERNTERYHLHECTHAVSNLQQFASEAVKVVQDRIKAEATSSTASTATADASAASPMTTSEISASVSTASEFAAHATASTSQLCSVQALASVSPSASASASASASGLTTKVSVEASATAPTAANTSTGEEHASSTGTNHAKAKSLQALLHDLELVDECLPELKKRKIKSIRGLSCFDKDMLKKMGFTEEVAHQLHEYCRKCIF